MAKYRKRLFAAAAVTASMVLAACGGGGTDTDSTPGGEAEAGGTLYYLQHYPFESTDPHRSYYGLELANFRRLIYRGLVYYPITEDPEEATEVVPDLATDTGTMSDEGRTWSFTIKDGVKWEDGSDITCEDFRYGVSRVFANDVITGGPNYILSYLDVPQEDGVPTYPGPYKATDEQQAQFDEAIECDGQTITYHFNKPWVDFPLASATLMMMDPYKESFDEGGKSQWKVLSNGPYKIEGNKWSKNKGATLVRNENYDPATDDPETLRRALPDTIEYQIYPSETSVELIADRMIADAGDDQYAVAAPNVPPSHFSQIEGPVEERAEITPSPYNFYLVPNMKSMPELEARQALAVAVDVPAVVEARGGEQAAVEADSIINQNVPGYQPNSVYEGESTADPEAAQALLDEAGVQTPYDITYTYNKSPTNDQIAAVLKENWDEAGFNVKLDPLTDTYYDVIGRPQKESDVMNGGWGADWPSAMTVLPPLFDSRPNFSPTTCGNNYGCFQDKEFESMLDDAANAGSLEEQQEVLAGADAYLGEQGAYIPLYEQANYYLRGSKVTGYVVTPSASMYPDLGAIGVEN